VEAETLASLPQGLLEELGDALLRTWLIHKVLRNVLRPTRWAYEAPWRTRDTNRGRGSHCQINITSHHL